MSKQQEHQKIEYNHQSALMAAAFFLGEAMLGLIPPVRVPSQASPQSQQPKVEIVVDPDPHNRDANQGSQGLELALGSLVNHFINCLKLIESGFLGAAGVLIFQKFMDDIRKKYPKFGESADAVQANPENLELQQALEAQAMTIFRQDEDARRSLSGFVLDEHNEEYQAMKKMRQARILPAFVVAKDQNKV